MRFAFRNTHPRIRFSPCDSRSSDRSGPADRVKSTRSRFTLHLVFPHSQRVRRLTISFSLTHGWITRFLPLSLFFLFSFVASLTDSLFVPSSFYARSHASLKSATDDISWWRGAYTGAVALTGGRGRGRERKKERKRDRSRHGGQFSGTCTGNSSPPLPPNRFSPLLCARLPRALHFLFLPQPSRSLVLPKKKGNARGRAEEW